MTHRVVFRRAARQEFEEAAVWYNERRVGLGLDFRSEIERALQAAVESPNRYPQVHRHVRCIRVRRFPYSIFFLVEPNRLVVLAVFHVRRDPLVWKSRT